jgi:hypothetical protein
MTSNSNVSSLGMNNQTNSKQITFEVLIKNIYIFAASSKREMTTGVPQNVTVTS